MPVPPELVTMMRKDPVRAFVGLPIAAAAKPNPSILVPFVTGDGKVYNKIQLPVWSGVDWSWWGNAAIRFADLQEHQPGMLKGGRSREAIHRARENLAPLHAQMQALGGVFPAPELIAKYYDKAVRLVIAAKNIHKWESIVELWLRDTFTTMPITAGETLAWLGGATGDVIFKIAKEAGKIAAKMGTGLLAGLGTFGTLALVYAGYRYLNRSTRRQYDGEEEA